MYGCVLRRRSWSRRIPQAGRAKYGDGLEISGRLSDIVRVVSEGWQTIENCFAEAQATPARSSSSLMYRPTESSLRPVRWVPTRSCGSWPTRCRYPTRVTFPGSHRVLLCADALDDLATLVSADGRGLNAARLFVRSVVVHEHFHAFIQTAPDTNGAPPPGPSFAKLWKDASTVNEALAVWMQLHMARDKPELLRLVQDYIAFGDFPEWPYAGAAYVEHIFRSDGLKGVRELVGLLRLDSPRAAARLSVLARGKASKSSRVAGLAVGTTKKSLFHRLLGRGSAKETVIAQGLRASGCFGSQGKWTTQEAATVVAHRIGAPLCLLMSALLVTGSGRARNISRRPVRLWVLAV